MRLVSLTFDDALGVHLDVAMPMLEEHGFRGTFFVPLGDESFTHRLRDWQAAAVRGHELGNHSILHAAVSGKSYVSEGNAIENYTMDRMRLELEAANRILAGIDGQDARTFAYPCCNPVLGRPGLAKRSLRTLGLDRTRLMGMVLGHPWLDLGSREQSYEPVAEELFAAARTGGDRYAAGADYPPPRAAVPSVSLDGATHERVAAVLDAFEREDSAWLVFMVHGIGGGHRLSCATDVFAWLLAEIAARTIPVSTFRDAALTIYEG